ncbi:MAG TPA: helix-turn-helix transcriptional regulator [Bacteroidia bacterium]
MKQTTGIKIRQIREIKNISQGYVARHLGITQGAYSNIECGKTKVDRKKLSQIASALEVAAEVIIKFDVETALNACLRSQPINSGTDQKNNIG